MKVTVVRMMSEATRVAERGTGPGTGLRVLGTNGTDPHKGYRPPSASDDRSPLFFFFTNLKIL